MPVAMLESSRPRPIHLDWNVWQLEYFAEKIFREILQESCQRKNLFSLVEIASSRSKQVWYSLPILVTESMCCRGL